MLDAEQRDGVALRSPSRRQSTPGSCQRCSLTNEANSAFVQTIQRHALPPTEVQQVLHNTLSANFRTKPLEELVDIKERENESESHFMTGSF